MLLDNKLSHDSKIVIIELTLKSIPTVCQTGSLYQGFDPEVCSPCVALVSKAREINEPILKPFTLYVGEAHIIEPTLKPVCPVCW